MCLNNPPPSQIGVACTYRKEKAERAPAPDIGKRQRDRMQNLTEVKLAAW